MPARLTFLKQKLFVLKYFNGLKSRKLPVTFQFFHSKGKMVQDLKIALLKNTLTLIIVIYHKPCDNKGISF